MSRRALRIGTRGSELALWQAHDVGARLGAQPGAPPVQFVHIRTAGDAQGEVPLWKAGGRAFFTREIDQALLSNTVDIAVHSLKDLPTTLETGLTLAAMLPRADPRDALLSLDGAGLMQLPRGARIGTSSLRRRAFLKRLRPDIVLAELRGNVPTRIARLQQRDQDAIVLAGAGLERLGLKSRITEYLNPEEFPPAVSQGVIGVCARVDDAETLRWLGALDDPAARLAASAERALLKRIEGGCQVPLGALATIADQRLNLHACVCALDGSRVLTARGIGAVAGDGLLPAAISAAKQLGERVAVDLLGQGAAALMAQERDALAVEAP
ncbi:MAG: hydroxymethylbilane synthase [Steroidobacteraceae bacterium]